MPGPVARGGPQIRTVGAMAKSYLEYGGALLTRQEWMRLGAHSRDLAGADFTKVFHGYLTLTDHPANFDAMAWVLQNKVLPGSVLSHSSAALLWGIPLPLQLEKGLALLRVNESGGRRARPLPAVPEGASLRSGASLPLVHCRVLQGASSVTVRGAAVHRWDAGPTVNSGRLTLSSPAETLRELATVLPPWDLVAAIDAVVAGKTDCPPTSLAELTEHLGTVRGRRGTAALRSALGAGCERSWSPGESIMRLLVTFAGFPEPELNLPVRERRSARWRYLDLAWPGADCVLEYDGDSHRTTKQQWREDERRRDEITSLGWTIIRANGADLWQPGRILLRLADALGSRGLRVPDDASIRRCLATLAQTRPSWRITRRQPMV